MIIKRGRRGRGWHRCCCGDGDEASDVGHGCGELPHIGRLLALLLVHQRQHLADLPQLRIVIIVLVVRASQPPFP
jgi:hypothetical protein